MSSPKTRGDRDYLDLPGACGGSASKTLSPCGNPRGLYGHLLGDEDASPREQARSLEAKDRRQAEANAQPCMTRHKELLLFHAARTM